MISANPAFSTILGYGSGEAASLSLFDLVHPDDRAATEEMFSAGKEKGVVEDLEHRCRCQDGTYRWFEWRAAYDASSGYFYGIARDISERKKTARMAEMLIFALDNAADSVYLLDAQGNIEYANECACRTHGYSREELTSLNINDINPVITPEIIKNRAAMNAKGAIHEEQFFHRRKNSSLFPVEVTTKIMTFEDGNYIISFARDITHRKKIEHQLKELQYAVDNAIEAIFLTNKKGKIYYANTSAGDLLGYRKDELTSMSIFDIAPDMPREPWDLWKQNWKDNFAVFESVHYRKDGTSFPVEISTNISKVDGVEFVCIFSRDISDRKKTVLELEKLKFAVDKAVDAVYLSDNKGNIHYVNNSACRTLGYDIKELTSLNIADIDPNITREALEGNIEKGRRGEFRILQTIHIRKDGTRVPVEVTAKVTRFEDTDYIVSFVRDITERKRAAKKLEELQFAVDNAIDAVYLSDINARIYYVNESACRQLGYSRDELLRMTILDIDAASPKGTAKELWQQGLDSEITTFESLHRRKDGTTFPVEISSTITEFEDHQFACSFVRDITDRKQHQMELQVYREHLEELVESRTAALVAAQQQLVHKERLAALGQLISVVSHELRNPLAVIQTSLFMLRKTITDSNDMMLRTLERAENNISRCDRIIDELQDYTRTTPIELQPAILDAWLNQIISEYEFPPDISVESRLDAGIEVNIEPERFRRCIFNLLSNACESLMEKPEDRARQLRISTRIDNNDLIIDIEDNGPGIPEDQLQRIFEPLFSTKNFGVGLGLAIVDQIVKQHNGTITVSSTEGKGTQFSISLPLSRSTTADKNED